ncbi:uncharacterized protein LOC132747282 [Ruditapes philippinarum]|uniref:uncharacterized protein LOC132747282 n=1 Tax=Ruditapes philippinarum TaxID=129788 RepID=UPI00295BE461|nr:uncharacterized protein LOC132747282 [Ruditapes philippinarum]
MKSTIVELICVLFLCVSAINRAGSLECYICSNALNINECKSTEICVEGQVCFKKRDYTNQVQFDMGCIDKESCGTYFTSQNASENAKMSAEKTSYCYECCSRQKCNEDLCDYLPNSLCQDDKSVDCAKLNSMFSICKVTSQAKKICPKYCNLCNLVDGNWSPWSKWSSCDVTCGLGSLFRHRSCTNPAPQNGGIDCPGKETERNTCQLKLCPVHGGWSSWGNWGKCSATCGVGMRTRRRSCTNPRPQRFGDHCFGDNIDDELCNSESCTDRERIFVPDTDCYDINKHEGKKISGVYNVRLWKTGKVIPVYCDFDTDSGGWTVFQNRFNGSIDFYKSFSDYERGFGSVHGEFWLGLKHIYEMVSHGKTELRMDMIAANGTSAYQTFINFRLSDSPYYTIHIDKGVGNVGLGMGLLCSYGSYFSTYDVDQDRRGIHCAVNYHGGWWYSACVSANPNGKYATPGTNIGFKGMYYFPFTKNKDSLKAAKLMFRRV